MQGPVRERMSSTEGSNASDSQPENDDFNDEDLASKGPLLAEDSDGSLSEEHRASQDESQGIEGGGKDRTLSGEGTTTSGRDGDDEVDDGMAAAFAEILAHPGPANLRNKAPILLVRSLSSCQTGNQAAVNTTSSNDDIHISAWCNGPRTIQKMIVLAEFKGCGLL